MITNLQLVGALRARFNVFGRANSLTPFLIDKFSLLALSNTYKNLFPPYTPYGGHKPKKFFLKFIPLSPDAPALRVYSKPKLNLSVIPLAVLIKT